MRQATLIVNPFASGVDGAPARAIEQVLRGVFDLRVVKTEAPGHATELARAASAGDALFVYAGDGVYNEVLNGTDGGVPLGLLPGGATSVLPRALGLPRDPVAAARKLAHTGRERRISLGRVNGRRFGFGAGVGVDAALVRRVDAWGRRDGHRAGDLAFVWEAAKLVASRRGRFPAALEVIGRGRAAFALVANTDPYSYAGRLPLRVAPRAQFELGLDVVAPTSVGPSTVPRILLYAFRGAGQEHARDVIYGHDLDRVEVVCDEPMPVQADGEDLGDAERLVFEAERDAVAVLV
jgi:diacylglycerol kinase family enzyme